MEPPPSFAIYGKPQSITDPQGLLRWQPTQLPFRTAVAATHRGSLLVVVMLLHHARPGARSQWEASFWSQIPEAVLERYWPRPLVGKSTVKQKSTISMEGFNTGSGDFMERLCNFFFFFFCLSVHIHLPPLRFLQWDYYGVGCFFFYWGGG